MTKIAAREITIIIILGIIALQIWDYVGKKDLYRSWKQPVSVDYALGWDLRVEVFGEQTPVQFWDTDNTVRIHISGGSYGHWKEYDLSDGRPDYQRYLDKCKVLWKPEGIRFVEPNGYELFIPKSLFAKWK